MICYYPYKQSFLGERPLARRHSCLYIMNRVPEIYIDLACVIQSAIQNYKGKHSKVMQNISQTSMAVLRGLFNYDIQLFLKNKKTRAF